MVVAAQHQQQQQQEQLQTVSPEEESLKRKTDCVYFLASPLTCKKGTDCEYRHSEYARVNPKDCYFWLNGNCLNPKCGFRHPPLDGLLGTQTSVSTRSSFPSLHSTGTPTILAPHNLGKQAVPCIFFQKRLCLKGDRCAFLHGPNPSTVNKASGELHTVATSATEPPTLRKASGALQKCPQEKKSPLANVSKAVVVPFEANKPTLKAENALPQNAVATERNAPPPLSTDDEFLRYKASNTPSVVNGNSLSHFNRLHVTRASDEQGFHHAKDTDEIFRESSPGFDVLVDNELRDSDYYHVEDQYGRTGGHEGKNLNRRNEYAMVHCVDYNSMADMEREVFLDPHRYDSYDHMEGQYVWEHHKASSDRVLVGGSSHQERRSYSKAETPNQIDGSDLRYHLSKHKRVNGLRSVVNLDYALDNQIEEQSHQSSSRRDSRHLSSHKISLSSRLRGRIKLPRRSPVSGNDVRLEWEMDRGRNWGSVSPSTPQNPHQGRLRNRIKGRVEDGYNNGGRNVRAPEIRRETKDDINTDFAGPKSLVELKSGKNADSKEQQHSLRKRKCLEDQQYKGDLSFDGPLPLNEILKRKRGSGTSASTGISSVNKEDNNQKESGRSLVVSSNNSGALFATSIVSKEVANNNEEFKSVKSDADGEVEGKTEVTHDQPSQLPNASVLEAEDDGMIGDKAMEDHDLEADDQRDGEYEYEQGDEGDYTYKEGEIADENAEDEYLDDEDGSDFAKKIGFMFS